MGCRKFLSLDELFRARHFDRDVVVLCVRWYLRFKLSCRDLVEMMAERGRSMAHTTIMRWVHLTSIAGSGIFQAFPARSKLLQGTLHSWCLHTSR
jgi:hypothetical protein